MSTSAARQVGRDEALQVFVRDNNVDQALRVLKKKMQREGIFRELKRRRFFEKPSERSIREKAEAVRRARKLARKQAIREGLLAAPKKVSQSGASSPVHARGIARS
jgi:small subunit ribosomal protein S21